MVDEILLALTIVFVIFAIRAAYNLISSSVYIKRGLRILEKDDIGSMDLDIKNAERFISKSFENNVFVIITLLIMVFIEIIYYYDFYLQKIAPNIILVFMVLAIIIFILNAVRNLVLQKLRSTY